MRIALAQINPTVGDIAHNVRKIVDFANRAKAQGAQIAVFPELCIPGYPPKDLLLKSQFIDDNLQALQTIAQQVSGLDVVVGYAARNQQPIGRPLHNAVAVIRNGKIVSTHFKTLLPTYDVFDESRYFEPGPANETENLVKVGDALDTHRRPFHLRRPVERRKAHRPPTLSPEPHRRPQRRRRQVLINSSASPFVVGKHDFRLELFSAQVKRFGKPLVYVNQVGGNDELVFDGNSVAFDASGNVIAQAKDFRRRSGNRRS